MMRKILFIVLAAIITSAGCTKSGSGIADVKIKPTINSRVTGLHFDSGDQIGLTITKGAETYADNVLMTYNSSAFTASGLLWYGGQDKSTLKAYYPYSSAGTPDEFTIALDQTSGSVSSDLLVAVKENVTPASAPVGMLFNHVMSQLTIVLTNNSSASVTDVSIGGLIPTAEIVYSAPNASAAAKDGVTAESVRALQVTANAVYRVVLVPQQASLTASVSTDDGKSHTKTLTSAQLVSGKRYDMSITLTDAGIDVVLGGDVGDWQDGGSLDDDDDDGDPSTLKYGGVTYSTTTIGGRVWMAENLRYVPNSALLNNGIWYPARSSSACEEPEYISARGMLYDFATALGDFTRAGNGSVQGICPAGWHIPDIDELQQMIGSAEFNNDFLICAGLWNSGSDRYGSETKGHLISATTANGTNYSVLSYLSTGGTPYVVEFPAANGVSVRCVKNQK